MDMESLKLFCDLVETRSFTKAAARAFISQSAASQRISRLEKRLGQILVERGKGKSRVLPTAAGRVLFEGARPLLLDAAELEERVRGLTDELAGTVRVATVYSVGLHALPGRLKPFLASHPGVNVHLEYSQTGKVYQDVLTGAVDVGIVACASERAGIDRISFGEEEMVVIAAPENPLLLRAPLRLADLEGQPFIAFQDGIPTRLLIDERLRAAGVSVQIVSAFDNIETVKNLVEIGMGIALLPENTVRQEVREGTLAVAPLVPADSFRRPAHLLVRAGRARRSAIRAFVDAMRREPSGLE